jgi:hypothetical protein
MPQRTWQDQVTHVLRTGHELPNRLARSLIGRLGIGRPDALHPTLSVGSCLIVPGDCRADLIGRFEVAVHQELNIAKVADDTRS